MNESKEEPAFPCEPWAGKKAARGLTKREWFAGMALPAVMEASLKTSQLWFKEAQETNKSGEVLLAELSYKVADAMIEVGKR